MTLAITTMREWLEGSGNLITLVYPTMADALRHREWIYEELKARGRDVNKTNATTPGLTWNIGQRHKVARFFTNRAPNSLQGVTSHRMYFEQSLRGSASYSIALFGFAPIGCRKEAIRFGSGRLSE